MAETRRSTFVPTVALGIASSGLTALAGSKPMLAVPKKDILQLVAQDAQKFAEVLSLALVVLACWGVLLVARGIARRIVAGLGILAALGVLVALVHRALSLSGSSYQQLTGWYWVGLVAAVVSLVAIVAAFRFAPTWPEMSSRYDAPTGAAGADAAADVPLEERSNIELWKSLDEGHDPTA